MTQPAIPLSDKLANLARQWWRLGTPVQRGEPLPENARERRTVPPVTGTGAPYSGYQQRVTRRYSRGATGLAFNGYAALVATNPIGAGVPFKDQCPVLPYGGAGMYRPGGIFFEQFQINGSLQPGVKPLYTPAQILALTGDVAAAAAAPNAAPPF